MKSLHLDTVGAMDAAAALADLVEISPQIEAAAVVAGGGDLAGSVGLPEARAGVLARAVRELLDGAAAFRSDQGRVTQLRAEFADGDVFAVAADERAIVAVARGRVTPGLVFYDLKRCLAALSAGSAGGQAAGARQEDRAAEDGAGADET